MDVTAANDRDNSVGNILDSRYNGTDNGTNNRADNGTDNGTNVSGWAAGRSFGLVTLADAGGYSCRQSDTAEMASYQLIVLGRWLTACTRVVLLTCTSARILTRTHYRGCDGFSALHQGIRLLRCVVSFVLRCHLWYAALLKLLLYKTH